MKITPKINSRYWLSLSIGSIFGANCGDFLSDVLDLGHISGLPWLAGALALVFVAEYFDQGLRFAYFWIAIIIIRAAATNIGDIFHDADVNFNISVPLVALAVMALVGLWMLLKPLGKDAKSVPVNGLYWITMFSAGIFGTVAGDCFSYALGLGNLFAAIVLFSGVLVLLYCHRYFEQAVLPYYWLVVCLIRSAGTAAGDLVAHEWIGLEWSTALSGSLFCLWLIGTYGLRRSDLNGIAPRQPKAVLMPE